MRNQYKVLIHRALHEGSHGVHVSGQFHPVEIGEGGVRFIRINHEMFMEQNKQPNKTTKWAEMARTGQYKITWIVRSGKPWGRIINNQVEVP